MDDRKDSHGNINHFKGFRDNNGLSLKSSEPMTLSAAIAFDPMGSCLLMTRVFVWEWGCDTPCNDPCNKERLLKASERSIAYSKSLQGDSLIPNQ